MIVKILNGKSIFENEDIKWFLMDGQIWISKYGDYSQIESKIGEFYGSFNWLYEENDTMLFDKEYGRLQIAIIDLVGKINIDHSQENKKIAEIKKDADIYISEKTNQKFEFPNQVLYSEVSDWLYSIEKEQCNQDSLMVAITEDFIFCVVNNQLKGWILKNASKHIYIQDVNIDIERKLLARFVHAVNLYDIGDTTEIEKLLRYLETKIDYTSLALKKELYELL